VRHDGGDRRGQHCSDAGEPHDDRDLAVGIDSWLTSAPFEAWINALPIPTPSAVPSVVPSSAINTDSHRIDARTCARLMPIARSNPNSRVRSKTESASVFAMPNNAITRAIPAARNQAKNLVDLASDRSLNSSRVRKVAFGNSFSTPSIAFGPLPC